MPTLLREPGCKLNLGSGRGCPLVVYYWAGFQSVHGLRCYGNITRTRNVSVSEYTCVNYYSTSQVVFNVFTFLFFLLRLLRFFLFFNVV